jgi:hypothetical protein
MKYNGYELVSESIEYSQLVQETSIRKLSQRK